MQQKAVIPVSGRMDQDTDEIAFKKGDHTYALNARFDKALGAVEDVLGTTILTNNSLPVGAYTCVGMHDAGEYVFFFLYSTAPLVSAIFRVTTSNNSVTLVLEDNHLDFNLSKLNCIDYIKDRDILYWTSGEFQTYQDVGGFIGYSPPRKLNVGQAILHTQTSGASGYPLIDTATLDVIKCPPHFPAEAYYDTDPERQHNLLYKKMLQFTYQYEYDDGEESVFGPYTNPILPESPTEDLSGRIYAITSINNVVRVVVNTGHHTARKIRIAVRDGNDGVTGVFTVIDKDELALADNTTYTVSYYGDESRIPVGNADLRNYDSVPTTAETQEVISTDRGTALAYGECREGFDRVDLDIGTGVYHWRVKDVPSTQPTTSFVANTSGSFQFGGFSSFNISDIIGITIRLEFGGNAGRITIPFVLTITQELVDEALAVPLTNASEILAWIVHNHLTNDSYWVQILSDFSSTTVSINNDGTYDSIVTYATGPLDYYSDIEAEVVYPERKYRQWKKGVVHPIGIVYCDRANRDGTVYRNESLDVYVPFPTEFDLSDFDSSFSDSDYYISRLRLAMNHQPPIWATHYRVVYQGNSRITTFVQRTVIEIKQNGDNRKKLSLEKLWQDKYEGADYEHEIQKGDIVRVISNSVTSPGTNPDYNDSFEFTVQEYLPTGGYQNSEAIIVEDFTTAEVFSNTLLGSALVEIYRPKPTVGEEGGLYYEISKDYEVLQSNSINRRHAGEDIEDVQVYQIDKPNNYIYLKGQWHWLTSGSIVITNSSALTSNDGTYTVDGFIDYNVANDYSRIEVSETIPADEGPITTALARVTTHQQLSGGGTPALLYLTCGDSYYRRREFSLGDGVAWHKTWIEDFSYSDYWPSRSYCKGKPHALVPSYREEVRKIVRNSQMYFQDANRNGLSTFLPNDMVSLKEDEGVICKLMQVGFTLKAIQEDKVTSIYLSRNVVNFDGQEQITASNKILGTVRPHPEPWGTEKKESVVLVDSNMYYVDVKRGMCIKCTPGGQVDISGKRSGMRNFWRAIGERVDINTRVVGALYRDTSEVIWMVSHIYDTASKPNRVTISYDYEDGRWSSFYSYNTSYFCSGNNSTLYVVRQGEIYEMGTGPVRNFFGTQYDWEYHFIFNENAPIKKILQSIELNVNQKVDVYEILIPADAENASGMESELVEGHFNVNEGTLFAPYLRDKNTPNKTGNEALYNGRVLRGMFAEHKIRKQGGKALILRHIVVRYIPSEPV